LSKANNQHKAQSSKPTLSPITVGITGGIGSGKSTVAHLFEILGYPVYYTDARAKWLMNNSAEIKQELIATFGPKIYPDKLDRKALADIVFKDKSALAKLNAITHPAVEKDFQLWRETQNSPIVFKEAAILFESGAYKSVDKSICVIAPEVIRVKRVMQRDKATAESVYNRIANQWPEEKKKALADFIIDAGERLLVIPQALGVLKELLHKNTRAR